MAKRTFDVLTLRDMGLPYSIKEAWITSTGRWSIYKEGIFEFEGTHYMVSWGEPATECQDERPWEYLKTVVAVEVEKRPVLVHRWVPANTCTAGDKLITACESAMGFIDKLGTWDEEMGTNAMQDTLVAALAAAKEGDKL